MPNDHQSQQRVYLQEMGIQVWKLSHGEMLPRRDLPCFDLAPTCRMLLVTPETPQGRLAMLFEKVLKTMNLTLDDARHVSPSDLSLVGQHQLEWIWLSGVEDANAILSEVKWQGLKSLQSPLLGELEGHTAHRRALWQQICSYQGAVYE